MAAFLDVATLVLVVVLAFLGAISGLIRETFRLAGMIAGFFVAFFFFRDLESVIMRVLPVTPEPVAPVLGFIIIFVAVFLVVTGVGSLLRKFTDALTFGWLDRALGALFGALKVGIVAWAVCLSISSFPRQMVEERFGKSIVYGTYLKMPDFFKLKNLEEMNESIRGGDKGDKNDDKKIAEEEPVSEVL